MVLKSNVYISTGYIFRISITSITTKTHPITITITNKRATQLLKNIYKTNKAEGSIKDENYIQKAFEIYSQINEPINHFVLNTMISLCLHFNQPDKIILLWDDIVQTIDNIQSFNY